MNNSYTIYDAETDRIIKVSQDFENSDFRNSFMGKNDADYMVITWNNRRYVVCNDHQMTKFYVENVA